MIYFTEASHLSSGCFLNYRSGVRGVLFPKDYDEIRKAHFALVGYGHHTVKTRLQFPLTQ
jgi:hypothetical protein